MDERDIVQSIISHINAAKTEVEKFPRSGMNQKALAELDFVHKSLDESVVHCRGIFGATNLEGLTRG